MRWVQRRLLPSRVRQVTLPSVSRKTYDSKRWKTLRHTYRRANPLCEACGMVLATEVHHVQPVSVAPSRAYDWDNLQALCKGCHRAKHR